MKIGNEDNYIELEVQLESDSTLTSYGDALIGIIISSNGYQGKNQVWVAQQEMEIFSQSILELEAHRKGEAILESMSPGELTLRVYSYDSLGHIAIEGEASHYVVGEVGFHHSVRFGFVIEPEQLIKLSKVKWVTATNA